MRKILKGVLILGLMGALVYTGTLIADRETLRNQLIRFHVVADSDSPEDQAVKLQVRDAVIDYLNREMGQIGNTAQAKDYLRANLHQIEAVANTVLQNEGFTETASVSLTAEEFPTRAYDTFSLPSGVYESLRIEIGKAQGHNWWCVIFPSLCLPATSEGFQDTAAGAGFSEDLSAALSGEEGYEIRFFFLDFLGKAENFLTLS